MFFDVNNYDAWNWTFRVNTSCLSVSQSVQFKVCNVLFKCDWRYTSSTNGDQAVCITFHNNHIKKDKPYQVWQNVLYLLGIFMHCQLLQKTSRNASTLNYGLPLWEWMNELTHTLLTRKFDSNAAQIRNTLQCSNYITVHVTTESENDICSVGIVNNHVHCSTPTKHHTTTS